MYKNKVVELSKKDVYIVSGYYVKDQSKFEIKINGSGYKGEPSEYKKIKKICEAKLKARIRILEVVTG